MKFVTLSPEEFEKFTSSHFSHYTQSEFTLKTETN